MPIDRRPPARRKKSKDARKASIDQMRAQQKEVNEHIRLAKIGLVKPQPGDLLR